MGNERGELSALTRLFSAAVFRELGQSGRSALFSRLIRQAGVAEDSPDGRTVGDAFNRAFGALKSAGNRDEYVYRTAITQKIVLGRHSLRTASVLHETRTGHRRADMVVLNGTSTAYEIKSERDSLARLANQLDSYRRVFATTNVVTSPSHAREVLALAPSDVGVFVLSDRFTIQVEREGINCPDRTSPLSILDSLRVAEAVEVLSSLGIEPPVVPNTMMVAELRIRFAPLDPTLVHDRMVATLKRTRSQSGLAEFVNALPPSVRTAVLAGRLTEVARKRIKEAIDTPLDTALTWS